MIPPAATVTVPLVALKMAVRAGAQVPTDEPSDQLLPRADQVPDPPAATPLPNHVSDTPAAKGVNTTFRSLPVFVALNEPPARALANPSVPLIAAVLIANFPPAKPLRPLEAVAIFQV